MRMLTRHHSWRARNSRRAVPAQPQHLRAGVLLEVVLALVLFAAAAVIIGGGLNASVNSAARLRLQAHAADLAVTVMSELQMGVRSVGQPGPEPFAAPFTNWTWQVTSARLESGPGAASFSNVEVVIRHSESALVHRLAQVLDLGEVANLREGQPR